MALALLPAAVAVDAATNATASAPAAPDSRFGGPTADWPSWQKDLSGSRYNADEHRITPRTVGQLKLKWAFTFANVPYARTGSQPAVVDGVLYVGGPDGTFYALDARTGATRWVYDLAPVAGPSTDQNPNMVRDGAAVSGHRVYFGDSRGYLYALDTRTGRLDWATHLDQNPSTWITSSPIVYRGAVYIGVSSIEAGWVNTVPNYPCCTFRGHVDALDAATGRTLWQHFTIPPASQVGTWSNGAPKYAPSGGAVWSSPVVDPYTGTLLVGTGQNYTGEAGDIDAVTALDLRTGQARWTRQMAFPDTYTQACGKASGPNEYCPGQGKGTALDFDFGATANLFWAHGRRVVGIGQKGGVYHALDVRTGRTVWQATLATADLTQPDPGAAGVQWGSSYDGQRIYAATWRPVGGPELYALDPATGKTVWKTPSAADGCSTGGAAQAPPGVCWPAFTPAVSSTPGLVYEGNADGKMRIYSARTGDTLWQYDAVRDYDGVNGVPGHGSALSGNGGAVISHGMLYVQAGYYPYYPSDKGHVLLAFGL
ncbi:MAG: PQQ-binding-like beta-propeller repeat protein [Mycobacteriales bacterium]